MYVDMYMYTRYSISMLESRPIVGDRVRLVAAAVLVHTSRAMSL